MAHNNNEWIRTRDELIAVIVRLGFPAELGNEITKNLGSPKAMQRMISYLEQVRPKKAELIIDEMLGIMSEIEAWRDKKECERANARYNEILNNGLE